MVEIIRRWMIEMESTDGEGGRGEDGQSGGGEYWKKNLETIL